MPVNVCNELFCVYMEYPSLNKLSEDYILVAGQKVICKFWKTFDVKISFNIPVDCGNLCNIFFTSHKYHINNMPVYSLIYLACLHFVMNYCLLNYFFRTSEQARVNIMLSTFLSETGLMMSHMNQFSNP